MASAAPTSPTSAGFCGEQAGVRVAHKHITWYTADLIGAAAFRKHSRKRSKDRSPRLTLSFSRMAGKACDFCYQEEFPEELAA